MFTQTQKSKLILAPVLAALLLPLSAGAAAATEENVSQIVTAGEAEGAETGYSEYAYESKNYRGIEKEFTTSGEITERFTYDPDAYGLNFPENITDAGKSFRYYRTALDVYGESTPETSSKTVTKTVQYANLESQDANAPETLEFEIDGATVAGTLKSVDYTQVDRPSQELALTKSYDYGWLPDAPSPGASIETAYTDPAGKTVTASIPFKELVAEEGPKWVNDVNITGSFPFSGLNYCVLEGKTIPYAESGPDIRGAEAEILKMLKLDAAKYRITGAAWSGPADASASTRPCLLTGERYAVHYRADYAGTVAADTTAVRYDAVAVYEGVLPVAGEKTHTVLATAYYELVKPETAAPAVVAATAGTAAATGGGVGLFLLFWLPLNRAVIYAGKKRVATARIKKLAVRLDKAIQKAEGQRLEVLFRKPFVVKNAGKTVRFFKFGNLAHSEKLPVVSKKVTVKIP
jgi:hypothetical protein